MDLKVICVNNSQHQQLIVGQVYEANLVFFLKDGYDKVSEIDWKNNYLNLKGFSEIDWFSTEFFVTLDVWRQMQIDKIL